MAGRASQGALLLAAVLGIVEATLPQKAVCTQPKNTSATIYDYSLKEIYGVKTLNMSMFEGQVVLFVNVATF
ncbi:hypothetical protein KUTeg_010746 [Tegillarca granosa]|uniref:Glutathione peroxidase n=1 Tax=Tegillarca granosa TaxID=220873 RepID=A0ABQ9F1W8_TEGGR|nr:hypothetical protein KUTeg_010746 [Tegillarca granosa]